MPHVAIESAIMIPLLVLQIIVFPFVAYAMTTSWANSRRQAVLQNAADQLGTTIQQLYFSLNPKEVSAGNVTFTPDLPSTIELYPYTATGSLTTPEDPNSSRLLVISLTLEEVGTNAKTRVTLGPNVLWNPSVIFQSDSSEASVKVQKFDNGTLLFSFG